MSRGSLPLFVLVLTLVSAMPVDAQTSGGSGAAAPVQTLLDAVPDVVSSAIFEAARDGTPDEAERTVAEMRHFVAGFEDGSAWPEGSEASDLPMQEILHYSASLVDLTAQVPGRVAAVERIDAACASWQGNVTGEEVIAWAFQARPAALHLRGTADGLEELAAAPPVPVDVSPLRSAVARLDDWFSAKATQTDACLVQTAERLGVPLNDDYLTLSVTPKRTWPHGTITILGGSLDPDPHAQVTIRSEGLGLNITQTLSVRGTYYLRHTIPANSTLSDHTIAVRSATNATEAPIEVGRIPVRLHVRGPSAVPLGEPYIMRFSATSVVPGLDVSGRLQVTGALHGEGPANGTLRLDGTAPATAGPLGGTFAYDGDVLFRPASRNYTMSVYDPALVGNGGGTGTAGTGGDGTGPQTRPVFLERTFTVWIPFLFEFEVPIWVGIIVATILLFLVVEVVLYFRGLSRPAPEPEVVPFDPPITATRATPEGARAPRVAFSRLFVDFHRWALRLRIARPSDTLRELAGRYARRNPALVRSVVDFERVRYGHTGRGTTRSPAVARRLISAWQGLVRQLRR